MKSHSPPAKMASLSHVGKIDFGARSDGTGIAWSPVGIVNNIGKFDIGNFSAGGA